MRKTEKKQAEEFIRILEQAHDEIRKDIENGKTEKAGELLEQCQEGAIRLGELIETREGESFPAISLLEDYCETVYQVYGEISSGGQINSGSLYRKLRKSLVLVSNSVRNEIRVRTEIVFLPYKAAMWDSLESIWMAADADPDCDAYVIPIPYYDRNPDGRLGRYHYEGNDLPEYVPVVNYEEYSLEKNRPDVIYIHNPYDNGNYVTSIDPRFYSDQLKNYTEKLVYVPYYSTSGGMAEGQAMCLAYPNTDYIVVQADKYKNFFDQQIPREKLLALGSPKFDRIIRLCQNPPEPPVSWKKKVIRADGTKKKVYFYNTSLNGMLGDTANFLQKMEYVFNTFQGREDACLLWRPHPLLESTFHSMRSDFKPFFERLRKRFLEEQIGIYDNTPDIEKTIAFCDAYIGDGGTSVTSLFGVAGKPIFLLNNKIHSLPKEDDWRGEMIRDFFLDGHDDWIVTQRNQLYYAPDHDYRYEFYCNLSDRTSDSYYIRALEMGGKVYVCPASAQDVLVVADHRIVKRISLERRIEREGAFCGAWNIGEFLFLIPVNYPAVVKIDTRTDQVAYIEGYNDVFVKMVQGNRRIGGSCVWERRLFLASPADGEVLSLDADRGTVNRVSVGTERDGGCLALIPLGDFIWLLPYEGNTVIRWDPKTGEKKKFQVKIPEFQCLYVPYGYPCRERPFTTVAESGDQMIFAPCWGDRFLCLDTKTGRVVEWKPPYEMGTEEKNGYLFSWSRATFLRRTDSLGEGTWRLFDNQGRRLYDVNPATGDWREIPIVFDRKELERHEPGFGSCSEWQQYACEEKALYSLKDFLDGSGKGNAFNRKAQLEAYGEIVANIDGTCGEKIHQYIKNSLS